jgi:hypothetical protein
MSIKNSSSNKSIIITFGTVNPSIAKSNEDPISLPKGLDFTLAPQQTKTMSNEIIPSCCFEKCGKELKTGIVTMFIWDTTKHLLWRGYIPLLITKTVYIEPDSKSNGEVTVIYDGMIIPECPVSIENYENIDLTINTSKSSKIFWFIIIAIILLIGYLIYKNSNSKKR